MKKPAGRYVCNMLYSNSNQRINNMDTIILIILIGLAGGIAVGL